MRRIAVTAAAISLLAAPVAASADPFLSVDDTGASGWLKGPVVEVPFTATFPDSLSVNRRVEMSLGPGAWPSLSSPARFGPFAEGSGPYTFRGQAFDLHGFPPSTGSSPLVTRGPFRIDSTAPSVGLVLLNGGISPSLNRYSFQVYVSGSDNASGLGMAQIGFTPNLDGCGNEVRNADGTGCWAFPTGKTSLAHDLVVTGPDGIKDIYVRLWDRAVVPCGAVGSIGGRPVGCTPNGNASGVYHGTMRLDTQAPALALVGGTTQNGVAGVPTTLDATVSTDPGESGIRIDSNLSPTRGVGATWDFGDGTGTQTRQQLKVTHTYPGPGSYKGSVRAQDWADNPAVLNFTVNIAPAGSTVGGGETPTPGGGQAPTGAGSGTPAPAGGGGTPAGGGATPGGPAAPVVVTPTPRILGLGLFKRRPSLRVSQAGVATVTVRTLAGRKLATFTKVVSPGRNRLIAPGRLADVLPDEGRVRLQIKVVSGGVAGPLFSGRVSAVALNPQPLPPKEAPARAG